LKGNQRNGHGDTRARLLEAAELLFIERGFDAMSMRLITARAGANLAAVNYHFGSKEALLQELLSRRLDRLNAERLRLLRACEQDSPEPPGCGAILGVLFTPALRLGRAPEGGPAFMRLLGRVYSDPSPFVRDYLQEHYRPIFGRFFDAFSRALPALPRNELGLRLHFALKALSGMLASDSLDNLIATLSMGQPMSEATVLARLIALISATITAPFGGEEDVRTLERIAALASRVASEEDARPAAASAARRSPAMPGFRGAPAERASTGPA
jgi:AcrR family transcriptional regulator